MKIKRLISITFVCLILLTSIGFCSEEIEDSAFQEIPESTLVSEKAIVLEVIQYV